MYAVFGECCLLLLLAGAGGEVRGGEVGELGWRYAVLVSFGAKGLGTERPWGRGWSDFICYLCGIVIYQLLEDTHQ